MIEFSWSSRDVETFLLSFLPYFLMAVASFYSAASSLLILLRERKFTTERALFIAMCFALSCGFGFLSLVVALTWSEDSHFRQELAFLIRASFLVAAIFWIASEVYCTRLKRKIDVRNL